MPSKFSSTCPFSRFLKYLRSTNRYMIRHTTNATTSAIGNAHHTAFTYDLTAEQLEDWAAMMGIECVVIGEDTTIRSWKKELRWNEVFFGAGG